MENEFPREITFSLQFMTFIGIAQAKYFILLMMRTRRRKSRRVGPRWTFRLPRRTPSTQSGYNNNDIIICQHVCGCVLCYTSCLECRRDSFYRRLCSVLASSLSSIRFAEFWPRVHTVQDWWRCCFSALPVIIFFAGAQGCCCCMSIKFIRDNNGTEQENPATCYSSATLKLH